MKLVTYYRGGEARAGLVAPGVIIDLANALSWYDRGAGRPGDRASIAARYGEGVLGFVQNASLARPAADAIAALFANGALPSELTTPLDTARLGPPLPRPPSMRDGYAFRQHVETARRNRGLEMIPEFDQFPVFYFTNHQAVVGPGELAVQPAQRGRLDFELEVAIVVGREGKNLAAAEADAFVFGFMVMNDWSARALQMEEMKLSLGPAKGKDFATGLGPYLVTADELAPRRHETSFGAVYDLAMSASVNDVVLSRGNLSDMTWTFAQILERVSDGATIYPGDVIGSGTVGTGCLLELNGSKLTNDQWLVAGDRVALEVELLGRLENVIVAAEKTPWRGAC